MLVNDVISIPPLWFLSTAGQQLNRARDKSWVAMMPAAASFLATREPCVVSCHIHDNIPL